MKKSFVGFLALLSVVGGVPQSSKAVEVPSPREGAKKQAVLFIPGMMGSELYRTDGSGGDRVWLPSLFDRVYGDLGMTTNGESMKPDVFAKYNGAIEEAYYVKEMYKPIIDTLKEMKDFDEIADYRVAPYDWRYGVDRVVSSGDKAGDLISFRDGNSMNPFIKRQLLDLCSSNSRDVTIIAHSNGGLVTKALLQKYPELSSCVKQVVFVASPQVGTPDAIGTMLHGNQFPIPSLFMQANTARELSRDMPGAYGLLPSREYFKTTGVPVVTFDHSAIANKLRNGLPLEIANYDDMSQFLGDQKRAPTWLQSLNLQYPSLLNQSMIKSASDLHANTLDEWVPSSGMKVIEIGGWGKDTLTQIRYQGGYERVCAYKLGTKCLYDTIVQKSLMRPVETSEGDGTVVIGSALALTSAGTEKHWLDTSDNSGMCPADLETTHSQIFSNTNVLAFLRMNVIGEIGVTLAQIKDSAPRQTIRGGRLYYELHSPLSIRVETNDGREVSEERNTIEGASYKRFGEVQRIYIPIGVPHTLKMTGLAEGSFTLFVEERSGNEVVASTTFVALPVATGTLVAMNSADGHLAGLSAMQLDMNGDGQVDYQVKPSLGAEVMLDITPPEAKLAYNPQAEKLEVTGSDDGGAVAVVTSATSTTLTDPSGNTLRIPFTLFKQSKGALQVAFHTAYLNGDPVEMGNVAAQFSAESTHGTLHNASGQANVAKMGAMSSVQANYNGAQNVTMFTGAGKKPERLPGVHLPFIRVNVSVAIDHD